MILCEDIGVTRDFYVGILGLAVQFEVADRYLEVRAGSVTLAFRLRSRSYDGPARSEPGAAVQLAFRVPPADVAVASQQLAEQGVELLEPVHDLPEFGHRVLFFADPEHNVIEIYAEI